MSTYAIGDIQGCFEPFKRLLDRIQFNPVADTLWFTGDLVNRGPQSLEVLRYVKSLGSRHRIVLGNHDLHCLAVALDVRKPHTDDTLQAIMTAHDRDELMEWLRHQSLLVHDNNYVMTHAGLAPNWTLEKAQTLAHEVEHVLRGKEIKHFLANMYGNIPDRWHDDLEGIDRLRCIVNFLTRLRLCHRDGRMDFTYKGQLKDKPKDLMPWFDVVTRANKNNKIIFGHWAALEGKADVLNVYPLDTGCVWGGTLTAMRLEDEKRFSVK